MWTAGSERLPRLKANPRASLPRSNVVLAIMNREPLRPRAKDTDMNPYEGRLGPYEVTALIGSGGTGVVYRARDLL